MENILNNGFLELVCFCLKTGDPKFIAVSLEALANLLNFGKIYQESLGKNIIISKLEEIGMFDYLEKLQFHSSEIVYEKAVKLLENFFETEYQTD